MKVLLVYPNQTVFGHKPLSLAMISAVLKEKEFETKLFDTSIWDIGSKDLREAGEFSLEFKEVSNPERLPKRKQISLNELNNVFVDQIKLYKPDLIGFSVLSDNFPLARKLAIKAKENFDIPIIFGGIHVTIDPESVIKENFVDMILIGEGEEAFLELCTAIKNNNDISKIKNVWLKDKNRIIRNDIRDLLQDLDKLPYPDWEIFNEIQFYKPFMGYVYRMGDFELSRGCPNNCSYCVNQYLHSIYKGKGKFVRRKSIQRIIDEIKYLKNKYKLEFLKFWDETFLNMPNTFFKELVSKYVAEINLPFVIETTAQSINEERAKLLKKMGCKSVSIGMECGNQEFRKKILNKPTSNDKYRNAFSILKKEGIRTSSFIMLGLPYETEENILKSIELCQEFGIDTVSLGIFYPYKGTSLRETCFSEGLLDKDTIENNELLYQDSLLTRQEPALKLTGISNKDVMWYLNNFILYLETPKHLWPVVDAMKSSENLYEELMPILKKSIYIKRFG